MGSSLITRLLVRNRIAALIAAAVFAAAPSLACAAQALGRISHPDGKAAANQQIMLNGKPIGQTDASGTYSLNLPPGSYTLQVQGKNINLFVPPNGSRQDFILK